MYIDLQQHGEEHQIRSSKFKQTPREQNIFLEPRGPVMFEARTGRVMVQPGKLHQSTSVTSSNTIMVHEQIDLIIPILSSGAGNLSVSSLRGVTRL